MKWWGRGGRCEKWLRLVKDRESSIVFLRVPSGPMATRSLISSSLSFSYPCLGREVYCCMEFSWYFDIKVSHANFSWARYKALRLTRYMGVFHSMCSIESQPMKKLSVSHVNYHDQNQGWLLATSGIKCWSQSVLFEFWCWTKTCGVGKMHRWNGLTFSSENFICLLMKSLGTLAKQKEN